MEISLHLYIVALEKTYLVLFYRAFSMMENLTYFYELLEEKDKKFWSLDSEIEIFEPVCRKYLSLYSPIEQIGISDGMYLFIY